MSSEEFDEDEETEDGRIISARNPELARRMESMRQDIADAQQRAEQADAIAKTALDLVNEKDEAIAELKADNEELRAEIEELKDANSIVAQVNDKRAMDVDDRAAVCIQTLANDAGSNGKASMTISEGWSTLGREFDRTRMYDVYKRAESLVEDDNVCWYQKESRGSNKVSRLILDRTEGDLPEKAAGTRLRGGSR